MQGLTNKEDQAKISHFLQSQGWEEFQKSVGRKVWRVDGVLVIKMPLGFGKSYLYAGGINFQFSIFNFQNFIKEISRLAKQENAIFFKLEPMLAPRSLGEVGSDYPNLANELLGAGFKKSKKEVQPQRTIILDITESEEQILAGMHSKTRYNIGLAGRHGVKFSIFNFQFSNTFWELLQKTAERDEFNTHSRDYYKRLLDMPNVKLFAAEYQNKIIAANIVIFHGERATYLHGASDYEYRNFMAPYLLHWEVIKYARDHGFTEYDLWGIDEKKWPGVTRFKRGFGGKEINYIGSYDYVFQPFWYAMYKVRQSLKK